MAPGKPRADGRRDGHFSLSGAGFALDKVFAGCPIKSTPQRNLCRLIFCRRLFAECCIWQRLCRVQITFAGCFRHPAKRLNHVVFTELKALENLYIQKSLKISFFFVQ
jgi:hypothetical protein